MKIWLFTDSFLPYISGVSSTVMNQANELARRGHSVTIFHPRPHGGDAQTPPPGLDERVATCSLPLSLPTPRTPKLRLAVPLFVNTYRRLRNSPPDLIHVHTEFGCGLEGQLLGRWKKIPVIGTFHTFFAEPEYLRQFYLPASTTVQNVAWRHSVSFFNRCSAVVTPSESVQSHLIAHGLTTETTVLSNGIEPVEIRPPEEIKKFRESMGIKGFSFLYLGRISPEKSLTIVFKAFAEVLKVNPEAKLVLIGDGPSDRDVDEQIKALGIAPSVIRTGRVERHAILKENYLLLGDVFVTASKTENQPISLLEAMVFGLPIVAPRAKGIPELVDDGRNGILFEPDDVPGMTEAMIRLMNDRELASKQSAEALAMAADHGVKLVGERLEAIYRRAIEKKKAAG